MSRPGAGTPGRLAAWGSGERKKRTTGKGLCVRPSRAYTAGRVVGQLYSAFGGNQGLAEGSSRGPDPDAIYYNVRGSQCVTCIPALRSMMAQDRSHPVTGRPFAVIGLLL